MLSWHRKSSQIAMQQTKWFEPTSQCIFDHCASKLFFHKMEVCVLLFLLFRLTNLLWSWQAKFLSSHGDRGLEPGWWWWGQLLHHGGREFRYRWWKWLGSILLLRVSLENSSATLGPKRHCDSCKKARASFKWFNRSVMLYKSIIQCYWVGITTSSQ